MEPPRLVRGSTWARHARVGRLHRQAPGERGSTVSARAWVSGGVLFLLTVPALGALAQTPAPRPAVALVGKLRIERDEYEHRLAAAEQQLAARGGTRPAEFKELLRRQLLETMIRLDLLVLEAKRTGLTVSGAEAESVLRRDPFFSPNGQFDAQRWQLTRTSQPGRFQNALVASSEQLAARRLDERMEARSRPAEDELRARAWHQLARATTEDLSLRASEFSGNYPEPREADVLAYYRANLPLWRRPDRATLSVVFVNDPPMTEVERREPAAAAAWTARMRQAADSILAAVKGGSSLESASARFGGPRPDITVLPDNFPGYWKGDAAQTSALFKATPGTVLPQPVAGTDGWLVVRVDQLEPAHVAPLASVAREIRGKLRDESRLHHDERDRRALFESVRDSLSGPAWTFRWTAVDTGTIRLPEPTEADLDHWYRGHLADFSSFDPGTGAIVARTLAPGQARRNRARAGRRALPGVERGAPRARARIQSQGARNRARAHGRRCGHGLRRRGVERHPLEARRAARRRDRAVRARVSRLAGGEPHRAARAHVRAGGARVARYARRTSARGRRGGRAPDVPGRSQALERRSRRSVHAHGRPSAPAGEHQAHARGGRTLAPAPHRQVLGTRARAREAHPDLAQQQLARRGPRRARARRFAARAHPRGRELRRSRRALLRRPGDEDQGRRPGNVRTRDHARTVRERGLRDAAGGARRAGEDRGGLSHHPLHRPCRVVRPAAQPRLRHRGERARARPRGHARVPAGGQPGSRPQERGPGPRGRRAARLRAPRVPTARGRADGGSRGDDPLLRQALRHEAGRGDALQVEGEGRRLLAHLGGHRHDRGRADVGESPRSGDRRLPHGRGGAGARGQGGRARLARGRRLVSRQPRSALGWSQALGGPRGGRRQRQGQHSARARFARVRLGYASSRARAGADERLGALAGGARPGPPGRAASTLAGPAAGSHRGTPESRRGAEARGLVRRSQEAVPGAHPRPFARGHPAARPAGGVSPAGPGRSGPWGWRRPGRGGRTVED